MDWFGRLFLNGDKHAFVSGEVPVSVPGERQARATFYVLREMS